MSLLSISEPLDSKEPTKSEIIVGIDLGTTHSLIGVSDGEKVTLFADENGVDLHPSIINFDISGNIISAGRHDDKSHSSVYSIKRLMGKSFGDVQDQEIGFKINNINNLSVKVGKKDYRCEELSAEILKYLKLLAEKNLKQEVKKCVISVPAYFDELAKNATKIAAEISGLEVVRLINEPTAAAFAYGLENASEGIYAIYDLGGGTFDISILRLQKGVFKVLGVLGDNNLGGDDFDLLIVNHFNNLTKEDAKKIKEELSNKDQITVDGKDFARTKFEELITPRIDKTIRLTTNLVDDLDLEDDEIKGIVLVGGSSRIPLIKSKLSAIFDSDKILTNLDPDRVVVCGAAYQAYNLSGACKNLLLDVNPLSLGIETMGGIVDKIIERNTTIPTAYAKEFTTYADNQTGIKLHIVQGERELAKDCRSLARFEIKNITPMKAGMAKILVTFKIDADGLLNVSAEDKLTGQKQEIEIKPTHSLSEIQIKKMLIEAMKNSKDDINQRLLIEAINAAKKDIDILNKDLKNDQIKIDYQERKLIEEKIVLLQKNLNQEAEKEIIEKSHQDLVKASENLILNKINQTLNSKIGGKSVDEI